MPDKLCVLTCENLSHELAAVLAAEGFDDVSSASFPSQCHHPQGDWLTLSQAVSSCLETCSAVRVIGGCFVPESGDPPAGMEHYRLYKTDHCSHLVAPASMVNHYVRDGGFVVTPGWTMRWRSYVAGLGFDQSTAREFFHESTSRMVLLDTGVEQDIAVELESFARFLDLPFEIMPVGLEFFGAFVSNVVLEWRLESVQEAAEDAVARADRKAADCAMAADLVAGIAGATSENGTVESILDLFTTLFAPGRLNYVAVYNGQMGQVTSFPNHSADLEEMRERLSGFHGDCVLSESGRGFILAVKNRGQTEAIIEVEELAFPEFIDHYLNVALSMAGMCGLAIANARTYTDLTETKKSAQLLYEREHHIAEVLQGALLSTVPTRIHGFGFETAYRAAMEEARIGGDFYDVFPIGADKVAIVVGDVSGKGLAAAVQVAMARNTIRSQVYETDIPSTVLERVNSILEMASEPDSFTSLFLGILDRSAKTLCYANAGHSPVILWRADSRECALLNATGLVLGCESGAKYEEQVMELRTGDELLLGTDGLYEVQCDGAFLGIEGFLELYAESKRSGTGSAQSLVERVVEVCGGRLRDDVAVLRVTVVE